MSALMQISCAAGCGETDKVPTFEDRSERDPEKRVKPVAGWPWICLHCWRAGWRYRGDEIYQLPGHPQELAQ